MVDCGRHVRDTMTALCKSHYVSEHTQLTVPCSHIELTLRVSNENRIICVESNIGLILKNSTCQITESADSLWWRG